MRKKILLSGLLTFLSASLDTEARQCDLDGMQQGKPQTIAQRPNLLYPNWNNETDVAFFNTLPYIKDQPHFWGPATKNIDRISPKDLPAPAVVVGVPSLSVGLDGIPFGCIAFSYDITLPSDTKGCPLKRAPEGRLYVSTVCPNSTMKLWEIMGHYGHRYVNGALNFNPDDPRFFTFESLMKLLRKGKVSLYDSEGEYKTCATITLSNPNNRDEGQVQKNP